MANPWFRMYSEFAIDPKVQMLSEQDQRRYIMLLCLRCNGDVTLHDCEVAFQLRISEEDWLQTKQRLMAKELICSNNQPTKWDKRQYSSDSSRERVSKHREKQKKACNGDVTLQKRRANAVDSDTDTDTDKEKPPLIPQQAGGLPSGDEAPKRQKRAAITFAKWLVAIREAGERPLSDYEALRRYMATVGLSEDFVGLAWVKFKERYGHDEKGRRKRYADWRAVFLRAVKENWFKLWFIDRDNGIQLTTIGKQADIEAAAEEGTA